MKLIFLLIFTLLFSACDLLESKEDKAAKIAEQKAAFEQKIQESKEVQLKKIDAQTQTQLANIESEKELAQIQKEQMLEKIRLESELEKQKIELEQKREQAILDKKMLELEHDDSMEIKRYLLLILFLMLIIASFFLYHYFKRRHQDQLRAYQDNLDKYFHQQENMTKMRIAEKIIDTVASGKLEKEQEAELIKALGATASGASSVDTKQLPLDDKDDATIELIEEKK